MAVWCCANDHDVDVRIVEELFCAAVYFSSRVVVACVVLGFGCALYDGVELELCGICDEGDVEDFGGETVAYYADAVDFGHCMLNDQLIPRKK